MTRVLVVIADPAVPEATVHLDVRLRFMQNKTEHLEVDPVTGPEQAIFDLTGHGLDLLSSLGVAGCSFAFGEHSFRVSIGQAFDVKKTLWDLVQMIRQAFRAEVEVGVSDDSNVFATTAYIPDPNLAVFDTMVDATARWTQQRKLREAELTDEVVERVVRALQAQGVIPAPRPPASRQM